MVRALLVDPREVLYKRHLVYRVRVMSVGCGTVQFNLPQLTDIIITIIITTTTTTINITITYSIVWILTSFPVWQDMSFCYWMYN
jgi:hypothetical protein